MAHSQGWRILVVEDEWLLALEITALLQRLGHEPVGPVSRIGEALALIEADDRIDAAILDLNVRGELTFPVGRVLRGRGIPVLFVTGYARGSLPDEFKAAPCLEKPISDDELAAQLAKLGRRSGNIGARAT